MDLVERAATTPWPGTTISLLKFPVMNPSPQKLEIRRRRWFFYSFLLLSYEGLSEMGVGSSPLNQCVGFLIFWSFFYPNFYFFYSNDTGCWQIERG